MVYLGFRGRSAGKESACNAGDPSLIPGSGITPGEGIATHSSFLSFPAGSVSKESTCNAGDPSLIPESGRFPCRRDKLPTPVFLGFPGGSDCKESACNAGALGSIPGWKDPLEEGMAIHYSILA